MKILKILALLITLNVIAACTQNTSVPTHPVEAQFLKPDTEFYLRAAQFVLESSEQIEAWRGAQPTSEATPLYRPDVEGPAYLEFPVRRDGESAGFIILATDEHDYPVSHYSSQGLSISEQLQYEAEEPVKIFKLDTLNYAAENTRGEKVAELGNSVMRLEGLGGKSELGHTYSFPVKEGHDAEGEVERKTVVEGASESKIEITAWPSWKNLKAEYAQVYEPLIEDLREDAASDWEVERLLTEYGEGLEPGRSYPVALPPRY